MDKYEKKYNEALKDMRAIYPNLKGDAKLAVEHAFPELRESEDERIIKTLKEYVKNRNWMLNGPTQDEVLTWLEKQKEQDWNKKPCLTCQEYEKGHKQGYTEGCTAGYNKAMKEIDEQKERKPNYCHHGGDPSVERCRYCTAICSARLTEEQKPAEWSEEDEKIVNNIVSVLGQYIDYKAVSGTGSGYATPRYAKEIDWLKSRRPSWKPSEEQMRILNWAANGMVDKCIAAPEMRAVLRELYNQLKKLM